MSRRIMQDPTRRRHKDDMPQENHNSFTSAAQHLIHP